MNLHDKLVLIIALIAMLWAAVLGVSTAWANTYPPTPTSHFYGDADGDTIISGIDVNQANAFILSKPYSFDTLQPANPLQDWHTCDLNSDRVCDGADANQMNAYILSKPVTIGARPWVLENAPVFGGLPLSENLANTWIPFSINLYSTHLTQGLSGRPGVSVVVEIDLSSAGTGKLSGRDCNPSPGPIGPRDQLAPTGAQCALAVTVTDFNAAADHGDTEAGTYGLAVWSNGNGDLALNIRIEELPALDVPAVTLVLTATFLPECSDGLDNDGDTLTDWPDDPECPSDSANGESVSIIAPGLYHTCALSSGGAVYCWGSNIYGQAGDGIMGGYRVAPVAVTGVAGGVLEVTSGRDHSCALTDRGGVKCWGSNNNGQLGDGAGTDSSVPVDVIGLSSDIVSVEGGEFHTCALTVDGGVKCWGRNVRGQLGDGSTTSSTTPVDVLGLSGDVVAITAGVNHTCALTAAGSVKCWGLNNLGQLGDGTITNSPTPVDVFGLGSGVSAVDSDFNHTCAMTEAGAMKCWGWNFYGQLGDGTTVDSSIPVDVIGLAAPAVSIAVGWYHNCALINTGVAQCWGLNTSSQLGDSTLVDSYTPVDVAGIPEGISSIYVGGHHSCVLTPAGSARCWGFNGFGALGYDVTANRSSPVDVIGLSGGETAVTAGGYHTCVLTTGGGVKCWGYNYYGQLGDGLTVHSSTPVDVVGLAGGVAAIEAGYKHTCAVTGAGGLKCWGRNYEGQIGDGTTADRHTPTGVIGLGSGVDAVTGSFYHTCALTSLGGVKCWGKNRYGQLGDGTLVDRYDPVDVTGLANGVSAVSAGYDHTCALTDAGGVKCWGWNAYGQLGDGTTVRRTTPVDVVGLSSGVAALSAGKEHTCALTDLGGVKCWGRNFFGQLGDGTTDDSLTPIDVFGLESGVAVIDAGRPHTCALTAADGIKCWGGNIYGQLGDGSEVDSLLPVDVLGLTSGTAAITLSNRHTCALTSTGGVKCWGNNWYGQMGDGSRGYVMSPVDVVWK